MKDTNYLARYGIRGQRWGFRRYQNEDGTLTPEGKERYGYHAIGDKNSPYSRGSYETEWLSFTKHRHSFDDQQSKKAIQKRTKEVLARIKEYQFSELGYTPEKADKISKLLQNEQYDIAEWTRRSVEKNVYDQSHVEDVERHIHNVRVPTNPNGSDIRYQIERFSDFATQLSDDELKLVYPKLKKILT